MKIPAARALAKGLATGLATAEAHDGAVLVDTNLKIGQAEPVGRGGRLRPVTDGETADGLRTGRLGNRSGPGEVGDRYVRIEGIAAYTALTVRHLHDLTRRREIPHIRVGKVVLYDKVAVDEWLSGRQTPPAEWPQQWRRPIGAAPARRGAGRGRTR
jgi:excisionase family DNA binding protein